MQGWSCLSCWKIMVFLITTNPFTRYRSPYTPAVNKMPSFYAMAKECKTTLETRTYSIAIKLRHHIEKNREYHRYRKGFLARGTTRKIEILQDSDGLRIQRSRTVNWWIWQHGHHTIPQWRLLKISSSHIERGNRKWQQLLITHLCWRKH